MGAEVMSTTVTGTRVNSSVTTTQGAFVGFKIDDSDFLDEIEGRTKCDGCTRSRKFFCYTCFKPMPPLEGKIPKISLPLQVDIVKHRQEIDGKSTATHGPLLAPGFVNIHTFPNLPEDLDKAILVFPGDDSTEAEDFMKLKMSENDGNFPYKRVIFVDSTWNQTYGIVKDERLARLPKVRLSGIESLFWRYQRGNPTTYLATIEAVYHFCVVYHNVVLQKVYDGEYDNILFFFKYMFCKIRRLYDPKKLRAYATRPSLQE